MFGEPFESVLSEEQTALFDGVQEGFFTDDVFKDFERFANEHCDEIEIDPADANGGLLMGGGEDIRGYDLRWTSLHNDFQALFERRLEQCIEAKGGTIDEFYLIAKLLTESESQGGWQSMFIHFFLAFTSFDVFVQMMADAKRNPSRRRAALEASSKTDDCGGDGFDGGASKVRDDGDSKTGGSPTSGGRSSSSDPDASSKERDEDAALSK
jgi:hypothetical protein